MSTNCLENGSAIIVGAGIAGAATALFLKRIGLQPRVFEARNQPSTLGGGLTIAPNGMAVLAELGVADTLTQSGSPMHDIRFRSYKGGLLAEYANARPGQYPHQAIAARRAKVHQMLLKRLEEEDIPVDYGKRLSGIDQRGDTVAARFEDGSEEDGSILVGADGIHSRTRQLILPETDPNYAGRIGVGGFVAPEQLTWDRNSDKQTLNLTLGPSGAFGFCTSDARDSRWMWWSTTSRPNPPSRHGVGVADQDALKQELLQRHKRWHDPVEKFIEATPEILTVPIFETPVLPHWFENRVVLVGDAAHAMSPHAGQGASVALEDSMYLARELALASDIPEAFSRYQQGRKARAEKIAEVARLNGPRQTNPIAFWLTSRLLRLFLRRIGPRSSDWMYNYQIEWPHTA